MKNLISVTALVFLFSFSAFAQTGQMNEFGPVELSSQSKPYKFSFEVENPNSSQYFIELSQGDGQDIVLPTCHGRSFVKKIFCILKKKWIFYKATWARPYWVEVKLNRNKVVRKKEFNWSHGVVQKPISLEEINKLKIKVRGRRTASVKVRIYKEGSDLPPVASFDVVADPNDPATFSFDGSQSTDDGQVVQYLWSFGDGNTAQGVQVSHTYQSSGNYTVSLKVVDNSGQENEAQQQVNVVLNQPPTIELSYQFFDPDTLELRVVATDPDGKIVSGNIDFGDGTSIAYSSEYYEKVYIQSGQYQIQVTVQDDAGAEASAQIMVTVDLANQYPAAVILANTFRGSAPLTVNFDGSRSLDPDGTIQSHQWQFYDKTGATIRRFIGVTTAQTYSEPGVYEVKLDVMDDDFLVKGERVYIVVDEPTAPIPAINISRVGLKEIFIDASGSQPSSGRQIVSYRWTLGGTGTSRDESGYYTYDDFGSYVVNLTVTDSAGISATASQEITLNEDDVIPPYVDFDWTVETDQSPYGTFVFNFSESNTNPIVLVEIDFGDGQVGTFSDVSNGSAIYHEYQLPGIYTVTVTATDSTGVSSQRTKIIDIQNVILPNIIISGGPYSGAAPLTVNFDASESNSVNGEIIYFEWGLEEDGELYALSYDHDLSYTFNDPGLYTVYVAVQDSMNRRSFEYFNVEVYGAPEVYYGWVVNNNSPANTVDFFNYTQSQSFDPIVSYIVDFGDGTTKNFDGSFDFVEHVYDSPGIYQVSISATTESGLVGTATQTVDIENVVFPVINITGGPLTGTAPLAVNFDASESTTENPPFIAYAWDFTDDGEFNPTSYDVTASHVFNFPGTYRVHFQAQDSAMRNVHHYFEVIVEESQSDYNLNILAEQISSSSGSLRLSAFISPKNGSVVWPLQNVHYSWDLGDGTQGVGQSLIHQYLENGPHTVRLIMNHSNGSESKSLVLNNVLQSQAINQPYFNIIGNNGKAPLTVQLDASSYISNNPSIASLLWQSSGSDFDFTSNLQFYTFQNAGAYEVTLTAINSDGFSIASLPKIVTATGNKSPLFLWAEAFTNGGSVTSNGSALEVFELPTLVKLSSRKSFSNIGQKTSSSWNLNGEIFKGEEIYLKLVDMQNVNAQFTITDELNNTESSNVQINVVENRCLSYDGANTCPIFVSHPDNILPISELEWVIDINSGANLLPISSQVNEFGKWIRLKDQITKKVYDLSNTVEISSDRILLKYSDFQDLSIQHAGPFEIDIQVIDENGVVFSGETKEFQIGFGAAQINVPGNSVVNVLNERALYFKQFEVGSPQTLVLNDLPKGIYSVKVLVSGEISLYTFEVVDENIITVDAISNQTFQSSFQSLKQSTQPNKVELLRPNDISKYHSSIYGGVEYPSANSTAQYASIQKLSTNSVSEDYPHWAIQFCNSDRPTQFPFASEKENELEVPGISSWVWAYDDFNGQIGGDYVDYRSLPANSLVLNDGARAVQFKCTIAGNVWRALQEWVYLDGQKCCQSQACFDGFNNNQKTLSLGYSRLDATPAQYSFSIKDGGTGKIVTKTVSHSFLSAAREMGLNSYESIIQYFGAIGTSGQVNGFWSPSFDVFVKVPSDFIDPELKVEIDGFLRTNNQAAHFSCYFAQHDSYYPKVETVGRYESLSRSSGNIAFNIEQIKNSKERIFTKSGKVPLNWGVKSFAEFNPDSQYPLEFSIRNGFGVPPDEIEVELSHQSQQFVKIFSANEFDLVESKDIGGEKLDIFRVNMDVQKYQDNFSWSSSVKKNSGGVKIKARWISSLPSPVEAIPYSLSKPVTYNASMASEQVCSNQYYSNFNPFGTPKLLQKVFEIDKDVLSVRCNDFGHPYGGVMPGHSTDGGHATGIGIDIRYPNFDSLENCDKDNVCNIDKFDKTDRSSYKNSLVMWANNLKVMYDNPLLVGDLRQFCDENSLADCNLLEINNNAFDRISVYQFCHAVQNDISISDFSKYCGNFPLNKAIKISKNTILIRSFLDDISYSIKKYYGGSSWIEELVKDGKINDLYPIINYDDSMGFSGIPINTWKPAASVKDKYNTVHDTHLHLNFEGI